MAIEAVAVLAALSALKLATIDAPTASVIVAIVGAIATLGIKLVPKTRPEAARDRSSARLEDAEAWDKLVQALRSDNQELRAENAALDAKLIAAEAKELQLEEALRALRDDFAAMKRVLKAPPTE